MAALKREERVIEGSPDPTGDGVALDAVHREAAGDVAWCFLVIRVVTRSTVRLDRFENAGRMARHAL